MSSEIYDRLRDVVPSRTLSQLDLDEAQTSCIVAFEVIGYSPENLEKSFEKVLKSSSDFHELSDFIYSVYKEDSS